MPVKQYLILAAILVCYGCISVSPNQQVWDSSGNLWSGMCRAEANTLPMDFPESNRTSLDPENISVLSWNIHKNGDPNWAREFEKFAANQDIIFFQEARLNHQLQSLLKQQRMYWSLNAAFFMDQEPAGVLTASPVQSYYRCGFRIPEPIIRIPKSALVNLYKIREREQRLLVANIHGINFAIGTRSYQKQMDRLEKIIRPHEGPVIIAGDFNNWSDERRDVVHKMLAALSLKSSRIKNSNQVQVFGNIIDHIFFRGLEPLSQDSKPVISSDHNPILLRFRVPPNVRSSATIAGYRYGSSASVESLRQ